MPEPKEDAAIRALAHQMVASSVFVSGLNVPTDLTPVVFLPFPLSETLAAATPGELNQLGIFAIHGLHATTGMQINGYPTFIEMCVWLRSDVERAVRLAKKMSSAMDRVQEEDTPGEAEAHPQEGTPPPGRE